MTLADKIKIKLLRNIVLDGYKRAGEVLKINNSVAQKLIDAKMAIPITEICQQDLFNEGDCG